MTVKKTRKIEKPERAKSNMGEAASASPMAFELVGPEGFEPPT